MTDCEKSPGEAAMRKALVDIAYSSKLFYESVRDCVNRAEEIAEEKTKRTREQMLEDALRRLAVCKPPCPCARHGLPASDGLHDLDCAWWIAKRALEWKEELRPSS